MSDKNKLYEDKIYDDILVDCKDIYEQNMSWYYYAQDEMEFPFRAKVALGKRSGQEELKELEVLDLSKSSSDFGDSFDLRVDVELTDYVIEVPLVALNDVEGTEQTIEVIEIWKYWKR